MKARPTTPLRLAPALLAAAALLAPWPASGQPRAPLPAPSAVRPPTSAPPSPPSGAPTAHRLPPPAPEPSAAPRAPAPSAEPAHGPAEPRGAPVSLHDKRVLEVLVGLDGRSPEQRAADASKALERLLEEKEEAEISAKVDGDVAVIYGGKVRILTLGPEDARAADEARLGDHAEAVAAKIRAALRAERQRSAIAKTVFAFSLLVFSGLIAFLLVRKVGELIERLRAWLAAHPDKLPALRVRDIEVVQPAAVRGGIGVALSAANLVARVGIFYAWVLIALSPFEATRDYSERLTGFVVKPVSDLVGRVALALPLVVIALVTVLVVAIAIRFVRLFFGSVARGETTVGWMPRDLAEPTSILVRSGIVVVTLVVAAPLVTGTDDGTLSRAGVVALVTIGLAATPVAACAAAGVAVVFGRRLRVGDVAGVGGHEGRVRALTMLEVLLEDQDGCAVHVPHLVSLWRPTRVVSPSAAISVEISVDPGSDLARVIALAQEAAASVGAGPRVEVTGLDADGAHVRVAVAPRAGADRNALYLALSAALRGAGVALGRRRGGRAA